MRRVIELGLVALAVLVGGCNWMEEDFSVAIITNETDGAVTVYLDYPEGEVDIMRLGPGESDSTDFSHPQDSCSPATLIARDASGTEVDRLEDEFCVDDRWEIGG